MEESTKTGRAGLVNKFRGSVLGAIVVCAVSGFAPGTALAGTLDQQQTDSSDSGFLVDATNSKAQTFTAGLSGALDQVDLHLGKDGNPTDALHLEIRNVSGGMPGSTVLASNNLAGTAVLAEPGSWVSISFAPPASVAAGTQYAIVAYSSTVAGAGGGDYQWHSSSPFGSNSYTGGAPFTTTTSPPTMWGPSGAGDKAFKTYVTPPDHTPPETAIGSKKIKGNNATFTFSSSEPGSTFECKLGKHSYKPCRSPKKYKHLSDGEHKFKVRAIDSSGNVDASPARRKFTI